MGIDLKPCSIQVYSKWYKSNTAIRKSQVKSFPIIHVFMLVPSSVFDMVIYRYPSICTILDLYEFDLYELFLLTKTFDLYECHSICTSFSLFLGRFFWQFGKILTFEGKMLKNWNDWNQLLKVFRFILEIDWILI